MCGCELAGEAEAALERASEALGRYTTAVFDRTQADSPAIQSGTLTEHADNAEDSGEQAPRASFAPANQRTETGKERQR